MNGRGAVPVLKWVGGKARILSHILDLMPNRFRGYWEAFIGGGAVFFELANQKRFDFAVIGDRNPDLTELYTVIRDAPQELLQLLFEHQSHAKSELYYYEVRDIAEPVLCSMQPIERAARTIFLNRTGFNGLYRKNRRNRFNVAFGKYANPIIHSEDRVLAASAALQKVEIRVGDFEDTASGAGENDVMYFDPPYVPVSDTANFTSYDGLPFKKPDHQRMFSFVEKRRRSGARCLLSNSDSPWVHEQLSQSDFDVRSVQVPRPISVRGDRRGPVNEIVAIGKSR